MMIITKNTTKGSLSIQRISWKILEIGVSSSLLQQWKSVFKQTKWRTLLPIRGTPIVVSHSAHRSRYTKATPLNPPIKSGVCRTDTIFCSASFRFISLGFFHPRLIYHPTFHTHTSLNERRARVLSQLILATLL